jgi:hypothetical protein
MTAHFAQIFEAAAAERRLRAVDKGPAMVLPNGIDVEEQAINDAHDIFIELSTRA